MNHIEETGDLVLRCQQHLVYNCAIAGREKPFDVYAIDAFEDDFAGDFVLGFDLDTGELVGHISE